MDTKKCSHPAWEHIGNLNYVCMYCGEHECRSTLQKPHPNGAWAKTTDHRIREKGDHIGEYSTTKTHLRDAQGELCESGGLLGNGDYPATTHNRSPETARARIRAYHQIADSILHRNRGAWYQRVLSQKGKRKV